MKIIFRSQKISRHLHHRRSYILIFQQHGRTSHQHSARAEILNFKACFLKKRKSFQHGGVFVFIESYGNGLQKHLHASSILVLLKFLIQHPFMGRVLIDKKELVLSPLQDDVCPKGLPYQANRRFFRQKPLLPILRLVAFRGRRFFPLRSLPFFTAWGNPAGIVFRNRSCVSGRHGLLCRFFLRRIEFLRLFRLCSFFPNASAAENTKILRKYLFLHLECRPGVFPFL